MIDPDFRQNQLRIMFAQSVTIKTYFPVTENRDTLQIKGSHSPGQGQGAHCVCPLQSQRGNGQESNNLRRSTHAQVLNLASFVSSAQIPLHLSNLYHQVVEFSHAALPFGWTRSSRIWTSVMSIVAAALRHHGMCTLLYVDDLLITCSSFEEASRTRQIIQDTLLASGIVCNTTCP
jgi:hypothetical protein